MSDRRHPDATDQWQRWQMDALDRPPAASAAPDVDSQANQREALRQQAFRRNAELETLRNAAREEARQQGFEAGFNEGRTQGYAQGLEEGRQAGEQALQQQAHEVLQPLQQLATAFSQALESLDEQVSDHLLGLALMVGRHMAGLELQSRPEQILDIIKSLLHAEPALQGKPCLWLNPADLAMVRSHLDHELHAAGWELRPDEQISRGGCRASSASGELDATWESRWEQLLTQLRHHLRPSDPASP